MIHAFLFESSTSIPLFKGLPAGYELLKALHKDFQLDPDQAWTPIKKLDWTDIKGGPNNRRRWGNGNFEGNWVIMSFKEGAAAVRYHNTYTAVVATPDGRVESENFSSSRGVLNFIKRHLGVSKLLSSKAKMYIGSIKANSKPVALTNRYSNNLQLKPTSYKAWQKKLDTAKATGDVVQPGGTTGVEMRRHTGVDLKAYRNARNQELKALQQSSPERIVQRFKPLWLKAANSALADINGIIQVMAKSGAYERLKHKIETNIAPLQTAIERLETTGNIGSDRDYYRNSPTQYFERAATRACALAAVYYYPDETGNVNAQGTPDNRAGLTHLMNDIDSGDMAKLKTVLDFFKQELMRATS